MLLGHRERVVGCLGRDGYQPGAPLRELSGAQTVGAQHQVAVGAPLAAVEDENDRPLLEFSGERHLAPKLVWQRELGSAVAHPRRLRPVIHGPLSGVVASESLQHVGRHLLDQPGVELISLLCERRSRSHLSPFV